MFYTVNKELIRDFLNEEMFIVKINKLNINSYIENGLVLFISMFISIQQYC